MCLTFIRDLCSAKQEADTLLEKTSWQLSSRNKEEHGFAYRLQPSNKQNGFHNNDLHRNGSNSSVFVDSIFQGIFESIRGIVNVTNIAIRKFSHGLFIDQSTQQKLFELDNGVLQVNKLCITIDLVIQIHASQEKALCLSTAFRQYYMSNHLLQKMQVLGRAHIRLQGLDTLECLTHNMITFHVEAMKNLPLLHKKSQRITSVIRDTFVNNINRMAYFCSGYIASPGRKMHVSTADDLAGKPKAVQILEAFANVKAAQTAGSLFTPTQGKEKILRDSAGLSQRCISWSSESKTACKKSTDAYRVPVTADQPRTTLPSAQAEVLRTTEDIPEKLWQECAKPQEEGLVVKREITALLTEDKENAMGSIRSDEENAAELHWRTNTPQPLDVQETPLHPPPASSSGIDDEGKTGAVPSDVGDEENMTGKTESDPDSGEDHDGFVRVLPEQSPSVHFPCKTFMDYFAKSAPGSGGRDMPDVGDESTPSSDDKGSARTAGEQEPFVLLHDKKMCASESVGETRRDQYQPEKPSPFTAASEDLFSGDDTAVINPKMRPHSPFDLDQIVDIGIILGMKDFHNCVTAQPVVPQSIEEGLARVDFRSPPRERMHIEGFRVGTFLLYPRADEHAVLRLANAGFYYTGRDDTLACFCCNVTFTYADRRPVEDPYVTHRQLNPNCPHLTGGDAGNVPVQDEQVRATSGRDITGPDSRPPEAAQLVSEVRQNVAQALSQLFNSISSSNNNQQSRSGSTVGDSSNTQAPDQSARYNNNNNINQTSMAGSAAATLKGHDTIDNISHRYQTREINREQRRPEAANQGISPQVPPQPAPNTERPSAGYGAGDPSVLERLQAPTSSPDTGYDPAQAVHPHYTNLRQRENSFAQWPDTHAQSPRELAVAGFFFTGVGDCVRCHYCGLGLKHWDPDDRPLDEHVRWRSSCGYLKALCGEEFLFRTLARLGGEQRRNQTPSGSEGSESGMAATSRQSTGIGSIPRGSHRPRGTNRARDVDALMTSDAANAARDMGFPDDVIRTSIGELLGTSAGVRAVTAQNLVHAILHFGQRHEDSDSSEHSDDSGDDNGGQGRGDGGQSDVTTAQGSQSRARSESGVSPPPRVVEVRGSQPEGLESRVVTSSRSGAEAVVPSRGPQRGGSQGHSLEPDPISQQTLRELEQENQELRERRRCKICLDNDVSILFLPCGHLVCCAECAPALRRCPMCRRRISGTVRIQLSTLPADNP